MPRAPQLFAVAHPFDGRLAVSRRPYGWPELDDDVAGWCDLGVNVVVSMLEADESERLGLSTQGLVCREYGIEFINCPVLDHGVPSDAKDLLPFVDQALAHLKAGRRVVAHCFAGMGRSPLFVACVLVRHGLDTDTAWERLEQARGMRLPDTDEQRQWVAEFADRYRGKAENI